MKTVLVTGTSTGIGEHTARALLAADKDVRVVGVSRREASVHDARYEHVQGDLTTAAAQAAVAAAVGERLDGAVFNAGVLDAVAPVATVDVAAFERVFDANVFSVLALLQRVLPALRAAGGNAVFVSSGAATSGYLGWAAYGASKAALNAVVRTLAREEPAIGALAVAPGVVDTDMQTLIRGEHVAQMGADGNKFLELKASGKLVDPRDSGRLYARLALGFDRALSGQYVRYDDAAIAERR